jgi:hypothetical protein
MLPSSNASDSEAVLFEAREGPRNPVLILHERLPSRWRDACPDGDSKSHFRDLLFRGPRAKTCGIYH